MNVGRKDLGDGTHLTVNLMTFGKARLCLCPDEFSIDGGWCYGEPAEALRAMEAWDGEGTPPGPWHRDVFTGVRREWRDGKLVREWTML